MGTLAVSRMATLGAFESRVNAVLFIPKNQNGHGLRAQDYHLVLPSMQLTIDVVEAVHLLGGNPVRLSIAENTAKNVIPGSRTVPLGNATLTVTQTLLLMIVRVVLVVVHALAPVPVPVLILVPVPVPTLALHEIIDGLMMKLNHHINTRAIAGFQLDLDTKSSVFLQNLLFHRHPFPSRRPSQNQKPPPTLCRKSILVPKQKKNCGFYVLSE